MRMLEFRAIHLDDGSRIPEQNLRRGFHDARFARACRPQKQQIANWPPRRIQTGAEDLVQGHKGLYTFLLPDDLGPQGSLKVLRVTVADAWIQLMSHGGCHRFRPLMRPVSPRAQASQADAGEG